MKKLMLGAQLDGYTPRKDGSVTLKFVTGEKTAEEIGQIHNMRNGFGYLYFRPEEELTPQEIEDLDNLDTDLGETKTKSQRLRNTLYVLWQQNNQGFEDFKDFYADRMEKLIQQIKNKLD